MFSREQYDTLRMRAGMLDRSARGRLQLTGADRLAYLQGLLTNDVAALGAGDGCYAALLTPQ
ncbi:MAG: glycine cleavage system aminomethyltransferase GcvT, partial [Vicinamibacterales bacterium]